MPQAQSVGLLDSDTDEGNEQRNDTDIDLDDSDASMTDSDSERAGRILQAPLPNADVPELRKHLRDAQLLYNETRVKLLNVKRELLAVSALVPARQRRNAAGRKGTVNAKFDDAIVKEAKRFAISYQFFLIDNLFPATPREEIHFSPEDPSRWTSVEQKRLGMLAELYAMTPQSFDKTILSYSRFAQVFRNTHRQERSNILKSVKEVAGILFAEYKLDPSLVSSQTASGKGTNPVLLSLLKRNGTGDYIRLAPILFENPEAMDADGFLKNPILVKIVRVVVHGKSSLSQVKRGGPKARGVRLGMRSVTEGLIAVAATMARFLLTPDPELSDVGSTTKIPYGVDYDFYLQRLFKKSHWANDVMDLFNREVFGQASTAASVIGSSLSQEVPARSWEDELLDKMDSENYDVPPVAASDVSVDTHFDNTALIAARTVTQTLHARKTVVPAPAPAPVAPVPGPTSTGILESRAASLSTTSQLQVLNDLGQMSISGTKNTTSAGSIPSARRVTTRKVTPAHAIPAFVADIQDNEMLDEQFPVQVQSKPTVVRATRARTSKTKKAAKD